MIACCCFIEFAVHELLLPDTAMVHGRFIVSAWEFGLDGIQDDAAKLLSLAVEVCTLIICEQYHLTFADCCHYYLFWLFYHGQFGLFCVCVCL